MEAKRFEVYKVGLNIYGAGNIDEKVKNIIKEKEKRKVYLFMDVDGCLIEPGLETECNKKTLEEWAKENKNNIFIFSRNIDRLKDDGILIGLCTGRGLDFSKKLLNILCPKQIINKSIIEGGLFIYDHETDTYEISPSVNKENVDYFKENRRKIIKIAKNSGGIIEKGKILSISINPPSINNKRNTDVFKNIIINEIENTSSRLARNISITNSSTAVEITPLAVDKLSSLNYLAKNGVVIYVGDGKNDETAMCASQLNLAPGNSHYDIKQSIKTKNDFGIITRESDIKGVNRMLRLIAATLKVYKRNDSGIKAS